MRISRRDLIAGGAAALAVSRAGGTPVPYSTVGICENGSHMSMYDDQQHYFSSLLNFLRTQPHA